MQVLVTGSRGYIGTALVPMLRQRGHDVTELDSDLFRACTFSGEIHSGRFREQDVRDVQPSELEGLDAVIHLAGLSNDPLGDYRPSLTHEINMRASVDLARAAKAAGVARFLFASSCSTYGASGADFLDESAPFHPVTPYGESKVRVEEALHALADRHFSPVYLRASTAYGVSPRLRFDLVLNNLTAWAFTTGRVRLKSDGTPWRPIVHVEDIARAYIAALEAPRADVHNEAFNVGVTSENYQIRELAEIVEQTVPDCRIELAPDAGADARCYRVDCNKIAQRLHGFKPQWTAHRGAQQLYAAFLCVGLTLADFEGPRFKRIAHIQELATAGRIDDELRWQTGSEAIAS